VFIFVTMSVVFYPFVNKIDREGNNLILSYVILWNVITRSVGCPWSRSVHA